MSLSKFTRFTSQRSLICTDTQKGLNISSNSKVGYFVSVRLISINMFRPIDEHFNIVYIHYINSQDNVVLGGTRQSGEEKLDI